jgi:putative endonuclease
MKLGDWGEEQAERFLRKKGYVILERNFRCRLGEIDIIAMEGSDIVFVEVKTRNNQSYGLPCESVNAAKIRHLVRTAAFYTSINPIRCRGTRLDVIEILRSRGKTLIRHTENITG